jgi:hypothetical protein
VSGAGALVFKINTMNSEKNSLPLGHKVLAALTVGFAACLIASCTDQDALGPDAQTRASHAICFSTEVPDDAFTRTFAPDSVWCGTAIDSVTQDSLPLYGRILPWNDASTDAATRGVFITGDDILNFQVSAVMTRKSDTKVSGYIFKQETIERADASSAWKYQSGNTYYWPGADFTLDFYAVSPFDANVSYTGEDLTAFSYTTPATPSDQKDLMVASATGVAGDKEATQSLEFRHLCAAVEFKVGNAGVLDGTVTEIRVKGLANSATYDFTTDAWTNVSGSTDYSVVPDTNGDVTENQRLFLIPQSFTSDDAKIEVDYTLGGEKGSFSYSLKGQEWARGTRYCYSINIAPEMTISFAETKLDAHYVMTTATITVSNVKSDCYWVVSAEGSSKDDAGNDVTIQYADSVNSYAQSGYWTQNDRGSNKFYRKGPGTYQVYIFAPENASEEDRTFTFTFSAGGFAYSTNTELTQHHPDWKNDGYGWEQIDDNESGAYGLQRTRKMYYIITYNKKHLLDSTAEYGKELLDQLIEEYDAGDYVEQGEITISKFLVINKYTRYYFTIDYSKMKGDISSDTDGLVNTQGMRDLSLSDDLCPFEEAVRSAKKPGTDDDEEGDKLYREASTTSGSGFSEYQYEEEHELAENNVENLLTEPGFLEYILKKNAYTLTQKTNANNDVVDVLKLVELKWYLPAKGQNSLPEGMTNPEDYWTSTSKDNDIAYLLDGSEEGREKVHNVRAVRNK